MNVQMPIHAHLTTINQYWDTSGDVNMEISSSVAQVRLAAIEEAVGA